MQTELLRRNYDYNVSGLPWSSSDTITFPLYSLNHELVDFQQYRPNGSKVVRRDFRNGTSLGEINWNVEKLIGRPLKLGECVELQISNVKSIGYYEQVNKGESV